MILFSRTFIRKRVISMATTASVAATSFAMAQHPARHHRVLERIQYAADWQQYMVERALLSRDAAAMRKMMADTTIEPSEHICCDFVEMMVQPDQGAKSPAKAELAHGRNMGLHRLAEETARQGEITLMQSTVSEGALSVALLPERSHALLRQSGSVAEPAMGVGTVQ